MEPLLCGTGACARGLPQRSCCHDVGLHSPWRIPWYSPAMSWVLCSVVGFPFVVGNASGVITSGHSWGSTTPTPPPCASQSGLLNDGQFGLALMWCPTPPSASPALSGHNSLFSPPHGCVWGGEMALVMNLAYLSWDLLSSPGLLCPQCLSFGLSLGPGTSR